MRITLLGTGTSVGIPMIGCACETCKSTDPRDKRLRTACHIEAGNLSIIIDTGPDFRQQVLRANVQHLDAVLWTHHHFDHIMGLDDLRPYFFDCKAPIPCFAHPESANVLRSIFPYIWGKRKAYPGTLKLNRADMPFRIKSRYDKPDTINVTPIEILHGQMPINGYRIGNFAYLTDVSHIPKSEYWKLNNLDLLVLNALRPTRHPRHFSISEAKNVAERIRARRTVFVHMSHQVLHARESTLLTGSMALGYDGMVLETT